MKEEFTSSWWKDFHQRYESTYGWYEKENKEKLLVYLAKVSEDQLTFLDKLGVAHYANPDKGNVFTFIPVEKGCYNYGNSVVATQRVPARQWKRGVCPANTRITDLASGGHMPLNFTSLELIFLPQKNENLEKFKKTGHGNVAFTNCLALANNNLYVYQHKIGKLEDNTFKVDNEVFVQEVKDMVARCGLTQAVST
jgi:hypothetical protein